MSRFGIFLAVVWAAVLAGQESSLADKAAGQHGDPKSAKFEVWTGAESFRRAWSLYTGLTFAPAGGIQRDGLRLRGIAGYSEFTQSSASGRMPVRKPFADMLVGYQAQMGAVTLKAFGGVAFIDQHGGDPLSVSGDKVGVKAVLETWWTVSDMAWSSLDLAWGSLENDYSARLRAGWRFWPRLSAGLEAGTSGLMTCNGDCNDIRVGAFLRHDWDAGEISVSGGLASDTSQTDLSDLSRPFATINWLTRF